MTTLSSPPCLCTKNGFVETVRQDLIANVDPDYIRGRRFWLHVVAKLLVLPRVRAVLVFRIGHQLTHRRLLTLALVLRARTLSKCGAEVHPQAQIEPGLVLVHSSGVCIGRFVKMGVNARIHAGAQIGEPGRGSKKEKWGMPTLGDNVTVGAHAVLVGPIVVGDGAGIGANSLVKDDVPAGMAVGGIPAKVLGPLAEPPSPTTPPSLV